MSNPYLAFDIADEVLALGLQGAYLVMTGLRNKKTDPEFEALRKQATQDLLAHQSRDTIREDEILQGFRSLHQAVGVSNRKNVASPESLLLYLTRKGFLPRISVLVDIYNLVSVQTRLALGAHDLAKISGDVHLRITDGTEHCFPLGASNEVPVAPGEYSYIDDANDVICRLEVLQVEKTKVTLDTTACFYIVQGNSATDAQYLKSATEQLITLTKAFCGGDAHLLYAPWQHTA